MFLRRFSGRRTEKLFETGESEVPRFGTGQVAEILDIPIWRLQKFLDVPSYPLSPAGKLGKGRGSRRLFSKEDVYRIGIANFLLKDGFAPRFVAHALQLLEDRDLYDLDKHGNAVYSGLKFIRGAKQPEIKLFPSGKPPDMKPGGPVYYALDFRDVILDIDRRIAETTTKKSRR